MSEPGGSLQASAGSGERESNLKPEAAGRRVST